MVLRVIGAGPKAVPCSLLVYAGVYKDVLAFSGK